MDHVLQETEKSRQMANHIAYTTFAAHGVNNGIFPIGQEVCLHNTSTSVIFKGKLLSSIPKS